MSSSAFDRIRTSLEESRIAADRILADAERRAEELEARVSTDAQAMARQRHAEVVRIRGAAAADVDRIDEDFARLTEAMATVSIRLIEAARRADFSPPPGPSQSESAFEARLSETRETREITFRFPPTSRP